MKDFLRGEFPQHVGRTLADLMANCKPLQRDPQPEDPELLEKTKSLRRPGETVLALCGRIGLGPRPLREWKLDRIQAFAAAAERNNADSEPEPHTIFSEQPKSQTGVQYNASPLEYANTPSTL